MNDLEPPSDSRKTNKRVGSPRTPAEVTAILLSDVANDLISEQVVRRLGSPVDLIDVRVFRLWEDHYRVNVLVGKDVGACKVANSFFLVTDDDGLIVSSSPAIARLY